MNVSRSRLQMVYERSQRSSAVLSPCVSVCRMEAGAGFCSGCYRTLDEIAQWSTLSDADKTGIWQQILAREQATKGVLHGK